VPRYRVVRQCGVVETARVLQMSGMMDLPATKRSEQVWEVDFDPPDDWNVGLIVGPSGAGKTTLAREIFGATMVDGWAWPTDRSILDGFPAAMGIKDVVELLSSVGFSSPPAWLRPYHVLSNGEKFRCDMARALAERPELAVIDEFTSVVDRTVAQVGSAALAKAVRRRGQRFVAVTCHYDVIDWLDPDWVFQPHVGQLERRSLQGRPKLELEVVKVAGDLWGAFKSHHYLSAELHKAAQCFVALYQGRPIAFNSFLHLPHHIAKDIKIGHRLVVLPDYQGLGIGCRFEEWLGEYLHGRGFRYHNVTAHPALVAYCKRSPRWRMTQGGRGLKTTGLKAANRLRKTPAKKGSGHLEMKQCQPRRIATFTFEYVPLRKGA
jgi:ABC-type ATPase involved in cell division